MLLLAILIFLAFVGYCVWYLRKRILVDHDPNKPFTSDELRQIGIIPPERYDEWLDEFARR